MSGSEVTWTTIISLAFLGSLIILIARSYRGINKRLTQQIIHNSTPTILKLSNYLSHHSQSSNRPEEQQPSSKGLQHLEDEEADYERMRQERILNQQPGARKSQATTSNSCYPAGQTQMRNDSKLEIDQENPQPSARTPKKEIVMSFACLPKITNIPESMTPPLSAQLARAQTLTSKKHINAIIPPPHPLTLASSSVVLRSLFRYELRQIHSLFAMSEIAFAKRNYRKLGKYQSEVYCTHPVFDLHSYSHSLQVLVYIATYAVIAFIEFTYNFTGQSIIVAIPALCLVTLIMNLILLKVERSLQVKQNVITSQAFSGLEKDILEQSSVNKQKDSSNDKSKPNSSRMSSSGVIIPSADAPTSQNNTQATDEVENILRNVQESSKLKTLHNNMFVFTLIFSAIAVFATCTTNETGSSVSQLGMMFIAGLAIDFLMIRVAISAVMSLVSYKRFKSIMVNNPVVISADVPSSQKEFYEQTLMRFTWEHEEQRKLVFGVKAEQETVQEIVPIDAMSPQQQQNKMNQSKLQNTLKIIKGSIKRMTSPKKKHQNSPVNQVSNFLDIKPTLTMMDTQTHMDLSTRPVIGPMNSNDKRKKVLDSEENIQANEELSMKPTNVTQAMQSKNQTNTSFSVARDLSMDYQDMKNMRYTGLPPLLPGKEKQRNRYQNAEEDDKQKKNKKKNNMKIDHSMEKQENGSQNHTQILSDIDDRNNCSMKPLHANDDYHNNSYSCNQSLNCDTSQHVIDISQCQDPANQSMHKAAQHTIVNIVDEASLIMPQNQTKDINWDNSIVLQSYDHSNPTKRSHHAPQLNVRASGIGTKSEITSPKNSDSPTQKSQFQVMKQKTKQIQQSISATDSLSFLGEHIPPQNQQGQKDISMYFLNALGEEPTDAHLKQAHASTLSPSHLQNRAATAVPFSHTSSTDFNNRNSKDQPKKKQRIFDLTQKTLNAEQRTNLQNNYVAPVSPASPNIEEIQSTIHNATVSSFIQEAENQQPMKSQVDIQGNSSSKKKSKHSKELQQGSSKSPYLQFLPQMFNPIKSQLQEKERSLKQKIGQKQPQQSTQNNLNENTRPQPNKPSTRRASNFSNTSAQHQSNRGDEPFEPQLEKESGADVNIPTQGSIDLSTRTLPLQQQNLNLLSQFAQQQSKAINKVTGKPPLSSNSNNKQLLLKDLSSNLLPQPSSHRMTTIDINDTCSSDWNHHGLEQLCDRSKDFILGKPSHPDFIQTIHTDFGQDGNHVKEFDLESNIDSQARPKNQSLSNIGKR